MSFSHLLIIGTVLSLLACQRMGAANISMPQKTPPFSVVEHCAAKPLPQVLWLHVHENETTAWAAAQAAIDQQGVGCVLTLRHGNGRDVAWRFGDWLLTFDPNRIFSAAGRAATLGRFVGSSVEAEQALAKMVADFEANYLQGRRLLVAVHNNHPRGISIDSFMDQGHLAKDVAKVAYNPAHSSDDFFYVINPRAFSFFAHRGFNVVLQDEVSVRDDGSLSVYAAERGIDYINVEAAYGHEIQQQAMLAAVYEYIRAEQLDYEMNGL